MSGKITMNGKDITKPFDALGNGKKVTKVTMTEKQISNDIYVGTKEGLKKLVNDKLEDVDSINVSDGFMTQVSDGTIYVGTRYIAGIYNYGLKKLVNEKLEDVDSTDVSNGFMTQVSDGTIYVGTKDDGLNKLVNDKLEFVDIYGGDGGELMTQVSDGTIYVGTSNEGLLKLVNDKLEIVDNTGVGTAFVTQVNDGTIYVGTRDSGLQKLVNSKLEDVDSTNVSDGFMTQVSDGTIYVGTRDSGLKKLVNEKLEDVDSTNVAGGFMTQVADGTIYVGTYRDGLKKLVNEKLEDVDSTDVIGGFMTQVPYKNISKTLTFGPKTITVPFDTSDETFKVGSDTIAKYFVTTFGNMSTGTHNGFLIKNNAETDSNKNMEGLLGNPYYIFNRYAYHNGWADEKHWASSNDAHIDLNKLKPYVSKDDEYLKVTLCMGSNASQNNLFNLDNPRTINQKEIYIRFHGGHWQYKFGATSHTNSTIGRDHVSNTWTALSSGDVELNYLSRNTWGSSQTANMMYHNASRVTFWLKFYNAVNVSWQGISGLELVTHGGA